VIRFKFPQGNILLFNLNEANTKDEKGISLNLFYIHKVDQAEKDTSYY
jgi:hypothetical protein